MFGKYYLVKITGKNPNRFLQNLFRMHVALEKIERTKDCCYVKVDEANLEKIQSIKTIYEIEIVDRFSLAKIEYLLKKNYIFLLSILGGILLLILLSNIIFQVEIVHSSKEIRTLLEQELSSYGIKPFRFQVGFQRQEKIVEDILKNHKKELEWLEIERVGTKYVVKVEQRKIKKIEVEDTPQNIVAKKDGMIVSIEATKGEVVKSKNDYVKKGDILITGVIKNKEEVKTKVRAEGKVFAETWYQVSIDFPLHYYDSKLTGKEKNVLSFFFLGKEITLFGGFQEKEEKNIISFRNIALPIGVSYKTIREKVVTDLNLSTEEASKMALKKAREKLQKKLGEEDEIISEKVLKMEQNDSKIIMKIFYKVKEDITATGEIILEEEQPEEESS